MWKRTMWSVVLLGVVGFAVLAAGSVHEQYAAVSFHEHTGSSSHHVISHTGHEGIVHIDHRDGVMASHWLEEPVLWHTPLHHPHHKS